jgi:hypothetical protein
MGLRCFVADQEPTCDKMVDQHFTSTFINRFFFEDYQDYVRRSLWPNGLFEGLWHWDCPAHLHRELRRKFGERDYSSIGILMHLQK